MATMTAATAAPAMTGRLGVGALAGTGTLIRFALRRDRFRIPVWIAAIAGMTIASAASFPGLYPDREARQARAEIMGNPAGIALSGPQIGVDDYTLGAMLTNEMLGYLAVAVALMSILMVVRHTRGDEETGRTELIRAAVVGRHAPLAAALSLATATNLALAVVVAVGLGGAGIETIDWAGSWLYAASLAAVGLVFAAVAAVTAQVTENARGASAMAGLVLAAAYGLRAVGDVGAEAVSWLSPIGWAHRTYAYVDDRWWPLLPAAALAVALVVAAGWLSARRDVGAGLRPARAGSPTASDRLISPFGLALRLQRGALIGWTASFAVFGLVYGTLLGEVETFASELPAVEDILAEIGSVMIDAFLALLVSLFAMAAAIHAVISALRARAEETVFRAEPVLATAVSRRRWLAGHAAVAALGGIAVLLAGCLGLAVSASIVLEDASVVPTLLGAALVQAVPVLLVVGLALALYGWVPRASGAVWLVVAYALTVGMLGGLLGLPEWAMELSPFAMVPMLPAEDFSIGPVLAMVLVAAGLAVVGFVGFRRRDLNTA